MDIADESDDDDIKRGWRDDRVGTVSGASLLARSRNLESVRFGYTQRLKLT